MTRALWAATLAAAALTVVIPGAAAHVRDALAFTLAPHPGSPGEAARIAITNLRFVVALRLARRPAASLLIANAALAGAAAGAYGPGCLPFLVHVPLEWAAFGARRLTRATALVLAAALAEAYATPQG